MNKESFVIKIPKELDKQFRTKVKSQGKQFNLAMEEAMKLWLKKNKKGGGK